MPATISPDVRHSARVFHALSDATRLEIIHRLKGGERCVCDLQDLLDAAQSRLSFHLRTLKEAGLVVDRKAGRWSYYSLVPGVFEHVSGVLYAIADHAGTAAIPSLSAGRGLPLVDQGECCD